jgi:hypothetical protein
MILGFLCLLVNRAKKLRAADFSWEAPPSPVKTSISSSAIIALRLRHKRHSVPPKESNACLLIVRGCLPQSLHSPQFQSLTRFTLIYPSCSGFPLATTMPAEHSLAPKSRIDVFVRISAKWLVTALCGREHKLAILVKVSYNPTVLPNYNRSLSLGQCLDELVEFL